MRPRRTFVLAAAAALAGVVAIAAPAPARAQLAPPAPSAKLQVDREAYAGMPFGVVVVAEGLAADPAPAQPALAIPGATVTPLGVEPNVSRISINGQRWETVTWLFRWRVVADAPGTYQVPAVTVTQGATRLTAAGGAITVADLALSDDMKLEVGLPARPVWVGETVPVTIDWLLRREVHDQTLSVPLLAMPGELAVSAPPPVDRRQVLAFPAGGGELALPYVRDQVTSGGRTFTRFRFTVMVTPQRAGAIELPAAQVVARLEVGQTRDRFGFPAARTQLFGAADVARVLDVRPLPQAGRPPSFAGAVGGAFSIAAEISRSVVQLGEPVDLTITVKADTRLDGMSLGALAGPGRLPADRFELPDTSPTGALSDDGLTKTFTVPLQVIDPATREIPPIELAWFDPSSGQYRTTRTEPIAVAVKGGTVVGADHVVGARPAPGARGGGAAGSELSLVGADLALSAPGAASRGALAGGLLWALIAALYAVPLAALGVRVWQRRTATRRDAAGEVASARRRVDAELARAATAPAREVAGPLVAALRALARAAGADAGDPVLARIETDGFAPDAGAQPLDAAVRRDAEAAAARWARAARRAPRGPGAGAGAAALLVLAAAAPARADRVADGRAAYQDAMAAPDPTARQDAFARAAEAFAAEAEARPGRAELLADWGNAALGAGDLGAATLAYRRALRADPDHARARRNLTWLRDRLPEHLRPAGGGAASTLLFFHDRWSRGARLLAGAAAFALLVTLLIPWRRRPGPGRVVGAAVAGLAWLVLTGSALLDRAPPDEAVVMRAELLRSADSAGAPAAAASPLPPGAEVTVLERRDGWARVRTAGGTTGWLPAPAVRAIAP